MIDSTNPRILANNIRKLFSKISRIPSVEGNPSGNGYNTLLTKLKIGSSKYKLPKDVTVNPEAEATGDLTKLEVGGVVYGIPSYTPPSYSTTEFDTGRKWIDSSPIYEKTIDKHADPVAVSSNTWTVFDTSSTDIKVLEAMALSVDNGNIDACYPIICSYEGGEIKVLQTRSIGISLGYLTIRYVKPSATAKSIKKEIKK